MDGRVDLRIDPDSFDAAKALDLEAARKLLRGRWGDLGWSTAHRWATHGCRPAGKDGPVLVLPTLLLSGRRLTMPEWVAKFERERARLGMAAQPDRARMPRPRRQREAAHKRAEERLRKAGVKLD